MSKPYDIILHGATGYTGRLVMRALLSDADSAVGAPNALKWAIAGRNEKKLEETKNKIKKFPEVDAAAADAVPIVVADSMNEEQIIAMVKQTKVVLSLVGPYKLYGETLVKACAENGVHYCDLAGETYWIREMIDKYQATAEKTGAKLVNCCGFDSVPSDLTTFALTDAVRKQRNSPTSKVNLFLTGLKGGMSGATIASAITMMNVATKEQRKGMGNPFKLTDDDTIADKTQRGLLALNTEPLKLSVKKETEINRWSQSFMMASCNSAIVHRSNYLLGGLYGDSFVYRERRASEGGYFSQLIGTFMQFIGGLFLAFGPTRSLIARRVTQPGDGPSEEDLQSGFVEITAFAYDSKDLVAARMKTTCVGDPGYLVTSKMISECAKCLATDETSERAKQGGFLTPASAFGQNLIDRLQRKRILNFELAEL